MSFRSPAVLLLAVVLVPAALALLAYAARQRAHALRLFLGARADRPQGLGPLARRRTVRGALVVGALAAGAVALAGPRVGTALRESQQESLDLIIALDVSDSMRAQDVAPTRLDRAKLEIERVVEARRGDRVGLVVFAGEAFLQCPLTTDRGALRLFLDAASPEQVAVQGTDFARALAVADQAFNAGSEEQERPRALLVVSDGEDHEGGLGAEADALRDQGVTLLALGVGTDEGAPVPQVYNGRLAGDRRDRSGTPIVTRFEPGALRDLAGRGGLYRVGRRSAAGAINDELDGLDRAVVSQDEFSAEAERFQWPLALALLLLAAERVVALRRPRDDDASTDDTPNSETSADAARPADSDRQRLATAPLAAALAGLMLLGGCTDPLAALQPGVSGGRAGVELLEAGDAEGAEAALISALATPDVPRDVQARLWQALGVARAQQQRYAEADSAFAEALSHADDSGRRARYAYDAGTAALLADDAARADSLLRLALLLGPDRAEARRNQEIARRRLETPPEAPEPSDLAERLKARADSLVDARQYRAALDVMEDGLLRDSTVAAYAEFIQRLGGVVEIEDTVPAARDSPSP